MKKILISIFALCMALSPAFAAVVNELHLQTGVTYIVSTKETFTAAMVPSNIELTHLDGSKFYNTSSHACDELLMKVKNDGESSLTLYTKRHIMMFKVFSSKQNEEKAKMENVDSSVVSLEIKVAPKQDEDE